MSYLKIYGWEKKQFPWHYNVMIKPEHRSALTYRLAAHWKKIGWIEVYMDKRGGGHARNGTFNSAIHLPSYRHKCSLALIIHEIAHVYDYRVFGGNGHRATFKKSLIKLMCEVKTMRILPPIFAAIRDNKDRKFRAMEKSIVSRERKVKSRERAREKARLKREDPSQKLLKAKARVSRLAAKTRRAKIALRKARREAAALERLSRASQQHVETPTVLQEGSSVIPSPGSTAG